MKMRFKTILSLLFAILFVSGIGISQLQAQAWTSHKPEKCNCKFKLPGEAETETNQDERAITYKYSTEYMDAAYLFSFTNHELDMYDPVALGEESLNSFVSSVGGRVVKQETWKVKKNTGFQATIQMPEINAACQYKVVIVGQTQYQLVAVAPVGSFDDDVAAKFFKSAKIK